MWLARPHHIVQGTWPQRRYKSTKPKCTSPSLAIKYLQCDHVLRKVPTFAILPDIFAYSHGSDDFFHCLFPLLFLLIVQLCLQLKDLPWNIVDRWKLGSHQKRQKQLYLKIEIMFVALNYSIIIFFFTFFVCCKVLWVCHDDTGTLTLQWRKCSDGEWTTGKNTGHIFKQLLINPLCILFYLVFYIRLLVLAPLFTIHKANLAK